MFNLLRLMVKEEWRIHSTVFGNIGFIFLPLIALGLSVGLSLALPLFIMLFGDVTVSIFIHYLFLFFGINVGAFGLFGKEWMNRRFGQASLLAYSSRTLPIRDRSIFFGMVIKDIIYYVFIWIIPLLIGFRIGLFFTHVDLGSFYNMLLSLPVSFFLGLSVVFFLSVLYAHFGRILLSIIVGLLAFAGFYYNIKFTDLFTFKYFLTYDFTYLYYSLGVIVILFILAIMFASFNFPVHVSRFKNHLMRLDKRFKFFKYSEFIAKDLLDFKRTGAGFGRIIFSYLLPKAFIWFFISFFVSEIIAVNFLVLFAIFSGAFSSSIYTWITEFDLFSQYLFLPVKVSDIIKSKIKSFSIINSISFLVLIFAAFVKNELWLLPVAILTFICVALFSLAFTIFLTGLSPSIMFMNFKVLAKYLFVIIPVMIGLIYVHIIYGLWFYLLLLVLFLLSLFLFNRSFLKWDNVEQKSF